MRRKKLVFVSLTVVILLLPYLHHLQRSTYSLIPPITKQGQQFTPSNTTIAILGDSYVANNRMDAILSKHLQNVGLDFTILSFGHPGAKSKQIYENLMSRNGPNAAFKILESPPRYCIVIDGVNDAAAQIGPKFYAHHNILIFKALRAKGIIPVLVTVPEFGIHEIMNNAGFMRKVKNQLMALYNNSGKVDNIQDYRTALHNKMVEEECLDYILQVDFDKVCGNYHECPDLYADEAHLSPKGYQLLGKEIAEVIKEHSTRYLTKP